MKQEELEKEMAKFIESVDHSKGLPDLLRQTAKHFYELGAKRQAQKGVSMCVTHKASWKMVDTFVHTYLSESTPVIQIREKYE